VERYNTDIVSRSAELVEAAKRWFWLCSGMSLTVLLLFGAGIWLCTFSLVQAAGKDSLFLALCEDSVVTQPDQVLLKANITGNQIILVLSDGVFLPRSRSLANAYISVDGHKVSNDSWIDWTHSRHPVTHAFRAVGAVNLSPGTHMVALVAEGRAPFLIKSGTNLAIMTQPADRVASTDLAKDSAVVAIVAPPRAPNSFLPYAPVATLDMSTDEGALVVLAAGRAYHAVGGPADEGDAWWGLWIDGKEASADNATYSDNDMSVGSEMQAPMFSQGMFAPLARGIHQVVLGATTEPWPANAGNNNVRYCVGAGTKLLAMTGIRHYGHVRLITTTPGVDQRFVFHCIGTSKTWSNCPDIGQDVTIAKGVIDVPEGHNGIFCISALTRVQGDVSDKGGVARFWLTIDGKQVGLVSQQQLVYPDAESTRTIGLNFLTSGNNALSAGKHVVELHGKVDGEFVHLAVTKDMPIMWFD